MNRTITAKGNAGDSIVSETAAISAGDSTAMGNAAETIVTKTAATLTVAGTSRMLHSASTAILKTRTASTAAK
jgi:hypothetical protein